MIELPMLAMVRAAAFALSLEMGLFMAPFLACGLVLFSRGRLLNFDELREIYQDHGLWLGIFTRFCLGGALVYTVMVQWPEAMPWDTIGGKPGMFSFYGMGTAFLCALCCALLGFAGGWAVRWHMTRSL